MSQRTSPTDAGEMNRRTEEEKGRDEGSSVEFGKNIGNSEDLDAPTKGGMMNNERNREQGSMENESSRRSGSESGYGSSSGRSGSGSMDSNSSSGSKSDRNSSGSGDVSSTGDRDSGSGRH